MKQSPFSAARCLCCYYGLLSLYSSFILLITDLNLITSYKLHSSSILSNVPRLYPINNFKKVDYLRHEIRGGSGVSCDMLSVIHASGALTSLVAMLSDVHILTPVGIENSVVTSIEYSQSADTALGVSNSLNDLLDVMSLSVPSLTVSASNMIPIGEVVSTGGSIIPATVPMAAGVTVDFNQIFSKALATGKAGQNRI
jgi:hypothetical protein